MAACSRRPVGSEESASDQAERLDRGGGIDRGKGVERLAATVGGAVLRAGESLQGCDHFRQLDRAGQLGTEADLSAIVGVEQHPDQFRGPGPGLLAQGHAASLEPTVDRTKLGRLEPAVVGVVRAGEGDEGAVRLRVAEAGDVLLEPGQVFGVFRQAAEEVQEEMGGLGRGDSIGDIGDRAEVRLAQVVAAKFGPGGAVAELVTQGHAKDVDEVRILRVCRMTGVEQGSQIRRRRVSAEGLGGAAADEGVVVLQSGQGQGAAVLDEPVGLGEHAHGMDADDDLGVVRGIGERRVIEGTEAEEDPETMSDDPGIGAGLHRLVHDFHNLRSTLHQHVRGSQTDGQVGMSQSAGQLRGTGHAEVAAVGGGGGLGVVAPVHDPPDPAALAVAAGVGERHLVMADDPVVEVGDVESAIGTELDIHGSEPGIITDEEVGLGDRLRGRALPVEAVPVDPAGDDVADQEVAAQRLGNAVGGEVDDAGDAGRSVVVLHHLRAETETVMRFAEARVIGAGEELVDRPAVAVAGVEVAERVEGEAERVDLAPGDLFEMRAVGAEAIDVARVHGNRLLVGSLHRGGVGEAVAGIDPAIEGQGEGAGHAVRVAESVSRIGNLAAVGVAVAVVVGHEVDVGDAMHEGLVPVALGQDPDRDVQAVGEVRDRTGAAVGSEVREDHHLIAVRLAFLGGERILARGRDPEPASVVEGQVHRLVDVRLGGDELGLEPRWQVEGGPLLVRVERFTGGDKLRGLAVLSTSQNRGAGGQ